MGVGDPLRPVQPVGLRPTVHATAMGLANPGTPVSMAPLMVWSPDSAAST